MSFTDEIASVRTKAADLLAQAEKQEDLATRLEHLAVLFPDLRKHVGRWEKIAYCSKSVNSQVTRFDMRRNCGCCSDSPLEVWPYAETAEGNIYSDPPCFTIGENSYHGDIPRAGWETTLRAAGIPDIIVGAIGMHFKRCASQARERLEALLENGASDVEPLL